MLKRFRFLILIGAIAAIAVVLIVDLRSASGSPQTNAGKGERAALQAKVDRYLMQMGEFNNDRALETSLKDIQAGGAPLVRIVENTYQSWVKPDATMKGNARPAEMRWRAIHLLGSLNSPEAIPFLYELAKQPLPDPRCGETEYGDAYRITLRSIDGLQKLKATEELKDLNEIGGVLSNPTAVALYELGVNVGGVKAIDARKALADDVPDAKDYNQNKTRPAQLKKPGDEKIQPIRRPDSPLIRKGD